MSSSAPTIDKNAVIAGLDFSTGAVKGIAFQLDGTALCEVRLPTDLWTADGVSELSLLQLEGQARSVIRMLASRLQAVGRLPDWSAIGISATHHTAGRIDGDHTQVRRAICWNDQTLANYHSLGVRRLGGMNRVQELIGGPWASRYSLSHLVKDEATLPRNDWIRTRWILPHGPLAAGYLTGRFDVTSVSSAASTGLMDLRTNQWRPDLLEALESTEYRELVIKQLPTIVDAGTAIERLSDSLALEANISPAHRPWVFPTSDDQQAGLVGGGAVDAGEFAVILGNSAVVNSSAASAPQSGTLDAMKLNWGPFLWMRCYNNGAQFLDTIVGVNPDWSALEKAARLVPAGCHGVAVMPFVHPEPSRGILRSWVEWLPHEPTASGVRFRAALESLACLIAVGVDEHVAAGQSIHRIIVSGGIAKSDLMVEILASVLNRPIERLESGEGPALGAAVTALWGLESTQRRQQGKSDSFSIRDAVTMMVRYRGTVAPCTDYSALLASFRARIAARAAQQR